VDFVKKILEALKLEMLEYEELEHEYEDDFDFWDVIKSEINDMSDKDQSRVFLILMIFLDGLTYSESKRPDGLRGTAACTSMIIRKLATDEFKREIGDIVDEVLQHPGPYREHKLSKLHVVKSLRESLSSSTAD